MGGPAFDRQVFVKKKESQRPTMQSPLPGGLVLVLVAALSAFATYRFVKAGGKLTSDPADKAKIAELQGKLKTMQAHIDDLEKSRRHATPRAVSESAKTSPPQPGNAGHSLLAAEAPHSSARPATNSTHSSELADGPTYTASSKLPADSPPTPASTTSTVVPPKVQSTPASKPQVTNQQVAALQSTIAANHEDWQAATDRLGNVVGELDSQRNALQKTQNGVNYLLQRVQSSDVPFTLSKSSGLQRVGPISMELASTSVKGQHYSIRMMVDDKSVELKDRALNEVIQFYTSRSQYPLRLIVSQIGRDRVSGTLAVPSTLNEETSSHQLQQR
jgi:hypothetical protein